MSAGHFAVRASAPQRTRNLRRVSVNELATARYEPVVDEDHDLPFLAGYSKDGKTVYIDRHLAAAEPEIDGLPYSTWKLALIEHELSEKEAIDDGMSYDEAHTKVATPLEHRMLMSMRASPAEYEKELRPYIKAAEHEKIVKPPKDLDCTPYKDDDRLSRALLSHLRARGVKDAKEAKKSHVEVSYGKGNEAERCGACRFVQVTNDPAPLRSRSYHCEKVVDPIDPAGWCKLFDRKETVN